MRVQLLVLGGLIVAVVAASFLVGGGGDGRPADTPPGTAAPIPTATTGPRGFPPAEEQSVCHTLLTTEEAEALVGRPLDEAVIEPEQGQCAWPLEEGNPRDAELFLIVDERPGEPISEVLAGMWQPPERFRFEPAETFGDDARFVLHLPDPTVDVDETFVVSLHVYARDLHVILGNGARDIWDGGIEVVEDRLRTAMDRVLERIEDRLSPDA